MADQSIALQARSFDPVSALSQVATYQNQQLATDYNRKTQDDRLAVEHATAQSALAQAGVSQETSALQSQLTRSMRLANAMAQPQDAEQWDAAMQQAVDDGLPEAAQYIGRYNPERQSEWVNALAAQNAPSALAAARGVAASPTGDPMAGTPGMAGSEAMAQRFANVDPKQYPAIQANLAKVKGAIDTVENSPNPQAAWAQAVTQFGHPEWANDPNWRQRLAQIKQTVIPAYNYLGALQLQANMGMSAPQPAAKVERVGADLVAVGGTPAHPTAESIFQGTGLGASGRSSVFQQKRQAWLDIHPDDAQGALEYASGRKKGGMEPAEMRKAAMAQASRDLQAATLAGEPITDAKGFLSAAADAHYAELQTAAASAPAAAATPGATSYSGAQRSYEKQFPEDKKAAAGERGRPYYPRSQAEYASLHAGAYYVDPTGTLRQKKK